jgi:hypothetical protein
MCACRTHGFLNLYQIDTFMRNLISLKRNIVQYTEVLSVMISPALYSFLVDRINMFFDAIFW